MFRRFITCGAADTNDSAMVMIKRSSSYGPINKNHENNNTAEICAGDKFGGCGSFFGTNWNQQLPRPYAWKHCDDRNNSRTNTSQFNNQKPVSAAYKPVNGPSCSQCGKMFKPQKMHTHMKSCRGMKPSVKDSESYQ